MNYIELVLIQSYFTNSEFDYRNSISITKFVSLIIGKFGIIINFIVSPLFIDSLVIVC